MSKIDAEKEALSKEVCATLYDKWNADGGRAFPADAHFMGGYSVTFGGMSLRQWYAGLAMQGFIAEGAGLTIKEIVKQSWIMADAMLTHEAKEREE